MIIYIIPSLQSGEGAFLLECTSEDWEAGFYSSQHDLRWMSLLVCASVYLDECTLESIVDEKYYVHIWRDEKIIDEGLYFHT